MEPNSGVHMQHYLILTVQIPEAGDNNAVKPLASWPPRACPLSELSQDVKSYW